MSFQTKWFGYRPDLRDDRDHEYELSGKPQPSTVDLRPHLPPCWNQGELGSCTAFGITGMVAFYHGFVGSQLWLYYKERAMEHTIKSDAGAEIRDGIKVLNHLGLPPLEHWPYDPHKFDKCPPAKVSKEAKCGVVNEYKRIVGVDKMLDCLASGNPFVFGITVWDSFDSHQLAHSGYVPHPAKGEQVLGGHCMCAVGYDKPNNLLLVRNSWDTDWGQNGHCWLPLDYPGLGAEDTDAWMITV